MMGTCARAMNKPSVHDMIAHPCTVFSSSDGVIYEPFPPERGFGILSEMSHPKSYTEVIEGSTCRRRLSRVRNSANPCVRDMSKSLRTCQMSVHGYPVDMSIFCNFQLGLLELQEDTPQADINQDNVSLAGVLQGAVITPCSRCCWTIIRGFHTIAGGMEHAVGTRLDAVFPIL